MPSNPKTPTIVALGSVNMDLVATMQRIPEQGETLMGDAFFTAPGGKGANQAVAAAKLGAQVRMVGRVGADAFGETLLDGLKANGIDTQHIGIDADNPTGIAMILLDAAGDNRIVAMYGANMACGAPELDAAKRAMAGADALMLQLETSPDISLAAAQYAREQGLRVIWDPAPAALLPPAAFAAAHILTPNQSEAEALTGIPVTDARSAHAAADALLAKGIDIAVVKLGEQGALAATPTQRYYAPPFPVDAIDTVAAGDAFGAALAVALSEDKPLAAALTFASAAGALATTKPGAQDAMPARQEVDALISLSR